MLYRKCQSVVFAVEVQSSRSQSLLTLSRLKRHIKSTNKTNVYEFVIWKVSLQGFLYVPAN